MTSNVQNISVDICDFERHIKAKHEDSQSYTCGKCAKKFVTNWRLKKHIKMHSNPRLKQCFYFKNDMQCPFDDLGCKFGHGLDTQAVDIIDEGKDNADDKSTSDTFNHEVQGDHLEEKKDDSILINPPFKDISFFTSTPKKSYKNHTCSKNNFTNCDECLDEVLERLNKDEKKTWHSDRLLRCLALSA